MKFEPFQDRLSRDIRNELSAGLLLGIEKQDIIPAQRVAERYLQGSLAGVYREYIKSRVSRYESALERLKQGTGDVIWQALVLWDLGLFYEVHEILEHAWRRAEGKQKVILQALIRAAGVYIKLEYGYEAAAEKMAGKAMPVLEEHRVFLADYFHPDVLLGALHELDPSPPRLLPATDGRI